MANRNDIYIWDPQHRGLPKDYLQAIEMAEQYMSLPDEPSDRLKRFGQEMASYAQSHQDDLEENVLEFLDSLSFVINEQTTVALCTGLPEDDWEQALLLTVERATAKGLIVVAPEIIIAFLPHGHILPPEQAQAWQALTAETKENNDVFEDKVDKNEAIVTEHQPTEKNLPKTLKQYHKWADVMFAQELSVFGFKLIPNPAWNSEGVDSVFVREVETGQQYINFAYGGRNPYFGQNLAFGLVSTLGEDIYYKFCFSDVDPDTLFHLRLNQIYDFNHYATGKVGINEVKRTIQLIRENILTLLDVAVNLQGLDALVNGDVRQIFKEKVHKSCVPHRLIIARLANNPQFEQLAIELKLFARDAGRNNLPMREQWDNLVKYLREDINPDTYLQKMAELKQQEQRVEAIRVQALQAQFNPQTPEELTHLASQYYDTKTNLVWQRCCIGQTWVNGKVTGNSQWLSLPEVQKKLAEVKAEGWRLPTCEELQTLKFSHRIGYITKDGFAFYEKQEIRFKHWISELEDIYIVSVKNVENPTIYDAPTAYPIKPDLRGSLRLVKTSL